MALIRKEEIGPSVLLMAKKQGTQVESDTFWLSPASQGPQCPPCYRPALSAKENESIQLCIHFAVKLLASVCPSVSVRDTRLQAFSLLEYAPFSAQTSIIRGEAEKTTYSACSLKTNFISQNASGSGESDCFFLRDDFHRSSRSGPYLGHLSGAQH